MKRKTMVAIALSLGFVAGCRFWGDVSYTSAVTIFETSRVGFEQTVTFLEAATQGYDFATFNPTERGLELIAGRQGLQTVLDTDIPNPVLELMETVPHSVIRKKSLIYFILAGRKRHGLEEAAGLVYSMDGRVPAIDFSWVKTYKMIPIQGRWFYYSY